MAPPPAPGPMPWAIPSTGRSTTPESVPRAAAEPGARRILRQLRAQFGTVPVRRVDHPPCSRGRARGQDEMERDPQAGGPRKGLRAHQGVTGNAVADDHRHPVHRPAPRQCSRQGAQRPRVGTGGVDEHHAIPRRKPDRTDRRRVETEAATQIDGSLASHHEYAQGIAPRQPARFGECTAQGDPRRWIPSGRDPWGSSKPRGSLAGRVLLGRVRSGSHQPDDSLAKQDQHLPQHPQGNEEDGQRKDDQNDQDDDLEHPARKQTCREVTDM